jgi:hypothetical protein
MSICYNPAMDPDPRAHPVNDDEADRHARRPRVPAAVAIVVAAVIIAALAYLRWRGVNW